MRGCVRVSVVNVCVHHVQGPCCGCWCCLCCFCFVMLSLQFCNRGSCCIFRRVLRVSVVSHLPNAIGSAHVCVSVCIVKYLCLLVSLFACSTHVELCACFSCLWPGCFVLCFVVCIAQWTFHLHACRSWFVNAHVCDIRCLAVRGLCACVHDCTQSLEDDVLVLLRVVCVCTGRCCCCCCFQI